jgi:glutathione synthase/RimK-type ligase-like ATP-grasp enzyme
MRHEPIIVISAQEDVHIPYVQRHLPEQMILVETQVDPKNTLSFVSSGKKFCMVYKGQELRELKGVWYRKPLPIDPDLLPVAPHHLDYSKSAITMHLKALYSLFPNATWVSDYYAIRKAASKPAQLVVATRLGFRVPETVFTNDSNRAADFVKKHSSCVVKPLALLPPLSEQNMIMKLFTSQISHKENIDFSGLYLAPSILQEAIDVVREVRVTVVGDKVFAAAITTQGLDKESRIRDYKAAYYESNAEVIIETYKLPDDVREKCITYTKLFNLRFCAIDLVEDTHGRLWFLEGNSNGQWAFVEDATGYPIGKTIAELLMAKS